MDPSYYFQVSITYIEILKFFIIIFVFIDIFLMSEDWNNGLEIFAQNFDGI